MDKEGTQPSPDRGARRGSPLRAAAGHLGLLVACLACLAWAEGVLAQGEASEAGRAASLRARQAALGTRLSHNQFQRPLVLESSRASGDLKGEIHAQVDYPFAAVSAALKDPSQWCDILILHLNVKYCRASADKQRSMLAVYVGRKREQPLEHASRAEFAFRVAGEAPDYLRVQLNADSGPFDTRNYWIVVEAVSLDDGRTFIHLSYSYAEGLLAKLALQGYLATFGSDKVGFTVVGRTPEGKPIHVGDERGVVERNTMRYFLAIDAYLNSLSAPPAQRLETRLNNWFAATERYPLQLHELERDEYLDMKRKEYRRQQEER